MKKLIIFLLQSENYDQFLIDNFRVYYRIIYYNTVKQDLSLILETKN